MHTDLSFTRRSFLGNFTGLAAATSLAGLIPESVDAAPMNEIKVAVIGCGGRGTGAASQILNTPGNCKVIAIADAFEDRAQKALKTLKGKYKGKVDVPANRVFVGFDAYKKAIDCGADLVILATPPGFRPLHFEYAISQGKHVFMEKPVAVDGAGVRRVLAANQIAKKKNLMVAVGLQRRHDPKYLETVQRLHDGAIGKINLLRVYWNSRGVWVRQRQAGQSEMEYQMRNWYYFNWLCGDHINEQHIHNIDIGNWVAKGFPIYAQGMGGRLMRTGKDHGEIFDHHSVEYTYEDGTKMLSQCRHMPDCWSQVAEFAHGSKGEAALAQGRITGANEWRFSGKKVAAHQQEQTDMIASLMAGKIYNEGDYGAMSTMTAVLGRMATYSGDIIKMEDALNKSKPLAPGLDDYSFKSTPPVVPNAEGYYNIPNPKTYKPFA